VTAWLADVLRAEGCRVSETAGWKSRGRPGSYAPFGVLNHHTATASASASNPAPTLNLCINGRSDLPGPLCQVMIGYDGVCHIVAAGRANHAGSARSSPPIPAGDGNSMMVGFEWDYSGTAPPSAAQYQAAIRANAAVLRRMGRNASYAKGHRETSVEGKIDPFGVDLDRMRAEIAVRLAGGPGPGDDDLPLNDADKKWLTDMVDARVNLQIRQLLAPNQEGYNRIIQASNDSIEQKGATLTRYAKDGSLQAK
jgi:hypothetical protein